MAADDLDKESVEGYFKRISDSAKINLDSFIDAIGDMDQVARNLNAQFGQTRQRMAELMTAVADAQPGVTRLGGNLSDVQKTMQEITAASRRNLVATGEDVEKIYAAVKVTGTSAKDLVENFNAVGVGLEQIPKQLESSINYIRSIGGNTSQVMSEVTKNLGQLNRYQFEGGVEGLTKMAAQATMLRFNMAETFKLADKVLDPDKAVEVASAFQRLGVSAGNLVDPFQLMNQSINDPSGLQNSLADVAKQFTYFDEKTKTFKINPQGVLTLKQIGEQTGVDAKELSKMGLAAAELEERLSAIGKSGLNIKDEDKQYLANIAKMGEGGEYEVKIKDDQGIQQIRKLSEISQTEFDKLIKEQKDGPKTMEELAKAQLDLSTSTEADVRAIRQKLVGGVASAGQILNTVTGFDRGVRNLTGTASKEFAKPSTVRKETETAISSMVDLYKDLKKPGGTKEDFSTFFDKMKTQFTGIEENSKKGLKDMVQKAYEGSKDSTAFERALRSGYQKLGAQSSQKITGKEKTTNYDPSIYGYGGVSTADEKYGGKGTATTTTGLVANANVDVGGTITVKFEAPPNVTITQQMMDSFVNTPDFKQYIVNLTTKQKETGAPVSSSYGN